MHIETKNGKWRVVVDGTAVQVYHHRESAEACLSWYQKHKENTVKETTYAILDAIGACDDATDWSLGRDNPQQAWESCDRPDWMAWLIADLQLDHRPLVKVMYDRIAPLLRAKPMEGQELVDQGIGAVQAWIGNKEDAINAVQGSHTELWRVPLFNANVMTAYWLCEMVTESGAVDLAETIDSLISDEVLLVKGEHDGPAEQAVCEEVAAQIRAVYSFDVLMGAYRKVYGDE